MNITPRESLVGAHVVVLGASTGIGLATAAAVKARGAVVTLVGRDAAKLEAAARELGGPRIAVSDITDRRSIEAVFAGMTRVDHLVITAGNFAVGRIADTDPDQLLSVVRDRIAGPLYAIKAALGLIPLTGSIVLTGGELSDRPSGHGTSAIACAVRGIEALARSLALELKPIRVNTVSPGFVQTPMWDVLGSEGRSGLLTEVAKRLPGGRIGTADEIADAIILLLENGYMNAEVLHIDGGGRFV